VFAVGRFCYANNLRGYVVDAKCAYTRDSQARVQAGRGTCACQQESLAQTKGILLSSHLWPEISAQLLCVTPTAHWLEYADWWNRIMELPLALKDGMTDVTGATGTGVSWNETALARYLV